MAEWRRVEDARLGDLVVYEGRAYQVSSEKHHFSEDMPIGTGLTLARDGGTMGINALELKRLVAEGRAEVYRAL